MGRFVKSDVEDMLADLVRQNKRFDFVVCDPPAFAKSAKKRFAGLRKMTNSTPGPPRGRLGFGLLTGDAGGGGACG